MPEVPVIDRPAVSARRDPVEPEAPETPARPPVPRVVGTEGEHAPRRRDAPRRRMLVRIAALLALVAIGGAPDVASAARRVAAGSTVITPEASRPAAEALHARYRRLVTQIAPLGDEPW